LDGGEKEVFLGGSRLTRFMETVEKASAAIPETTVEDQAQEAAAEPALTEADVETLMAGSVATTQSPTPLAGLLQQGLVLLEQLAVASQSASANGSRDKTARTDFASSFIGKDERTGQSFLKLPMPKPEVLDQALQVIGKLMEGWRT
jgi:hypothetical protein